MAEGETIRRARKLRSHVVSASLPGLHVATSEARDPMADDALGPLQHPE